MRCPTCTAEGRTSCLFLNRAASLGPKLVERFWDEDDKIHVHDHEVRTSVYSCTNGHNHKLETMGECPQEGCSWNDQPAVKAGREGL